MAPLVGVSAFMISKYKKDLTIYPGSNSTRGWNGDQISTNGNSETHLFQDNKDSILFSFTIRMGDKGKYPFCLIHFLPSTEQYFDVSDYDYIEFELNASVENGNLTTIRTNIQVEVPSYSVKGNLDTYRIMNQDLIYQKNSRKYKLAISKFNTPAWWWEKNPALPRNAAGSPDYSKVTEVQIAASAHLNMGLKQHFTVYGVTAGKNNFLLILYAFFLMAAYYGLVWIVLKLQKVKSSISSLPGKKIEIGNVSDEETKKVVEYIKMNFINPELNSEMLQQNLGLSENRISWILKSSFNSSFKKYLNQVRLEEARRLLSETSMQINEIAWKVGYASVTHFNRVFKEAEGHSPNEYRKMYRESADTHKEGKNT